MGDMADYTLDLAFNEELFDPEDDGPFPPKTVTCRYCGQSGYHWGFVDRVGWRLHCPAGRLHSCKTYSPSAASKPPARPAQSRERTEFAPVPAGYVMSEARRQLMGGKRRKP